MHRKRSVNIVDTSVDKNCVSAENKSKHPTFLENVASYGVEYADYSGLHGVRYLGEQRRNIWEKLWWLIVLIASLYFCMRLILESYAKFANSPIIISSADSPTPLWQIPFPAITVCPNNHCRDTIYNFKAKLRNVTNAFSEIPDDELKEFYNALLACGHYSPDVPPIPDRLNYTIDSNFYKFIEKAAPRLEETIVHCGGLNITQTVRELFSTVLTDIGLCFTFNLLDKKDIYKSEVDLSDYMMKSRPRNGWTLDDGYSQYYTPDTFPERALPGSKGSFVLQLSANKLDQTEEYRTGFQIMLHNADEVPSFNMPKIDAAFNAGVHITIKPDLMVAEEELRNYNPRTRNCYFSSERPLRYYQNYTQTNCETECVANYTLATCGCVPMWFPHNSTTKVCGHGEILCTGQAQDDILLSDLNAYVSNDEELKFGTCNCMPRCSHIKYNTEVKNVKEYAGHLISTIVIIKFKEREYIALTRKENYGMKDFIADCGGNLGLFVGFSFLSIFETVYFFSLRICCNIRRHGKHYWSGSSDLIGQEVEDKSKKNNTRPDVKPEDTSNEPGDIKLNKAVFNVDVP